MTSGSAIHAAEAENRDARGTDLSIARRTSITRFRLAGMSISACPVTIWGLDSNQSSTLGVCLKLNEMQADKAGRLSMDDSEVGKRFCKLSFYMR